MDEKLVVFKLAAEIYGVAVNQVQSIIEMQPMTRIPGAPGFIEGVINLRGTIVPVIDLRARFGLPASGESKGVIVIIELDGQQIGMMVDRVTDVTKVSSSAIVPPSPLLTSVDTAYLRGLVRLSERLIILLDLNRVFSPDEQRALKEGVPLVSEAAG
jgi:purine-binding chemotaxis protein CheW